MNTRQDPIPEPADDRPEADAATETAEAYRLGRHERRYYDSERSIEERINEDGAAQRYR